ncbi:protein translocase subunit SecD [Actinokineospora globicatena]|uniref:protein translocase subunit SecD n=1 Tax=Actinokineospora globicatena TaxID=103729 RepID=UPI0020A424CE|nr:protein translocase subunit SecD [Actinokineospora globicatena]MCP2304200.1 preprotein translocase subunit SecD [Actinokineospora globicatena]GLW78442.1 protein translocase subunit SecD [Actinokineospora globicatena]GLW84894.1 protein translocase subunit SecD [Actinokineospora globicatena]
MAPPVGQIRPGRYLAFFVAIVAVLYTLVFATGDHRAVPKLGIDLQGGTRVALTARTETGEPPSKESLNVSREIIDTRVNGTGVQGAEVVLDGTTIVITVPGENGEKAKDLGQTAQLRFRPVIGSVAAQAQPQPSTEPQPSVQPDPSATGSAPPTATSGAPASGTPSAGAPSSTAAPQGRPAPALAQQPSSGAPAATTTAAPPATTTAATPPPADNPCTQYSALLADPKAETAALISAGKKCRQAPTLAPSKGADGAEVPADQALQQAALAAIDCAPGKKDPLVGNDDKSLPLAACDQDGVEKFILGPSFLEGTEINNATSQLDPQGVGYVVSISFKATGSKVWSEYTASHVQERAAFVLDTQVVSAPTIQGAINGDTQITGGQGGFKQAEAQKLANVLKFGSLPLSFEPSEAETVSATLGIASLEAGLIAGAIGLGLVFLYCLVYYRLLGLLTILSLVLSGVIVYAVLVLLGRWIGYSLDLPGVAGLIVAVGFTADSFVIFFERLKDEIREGRSFRSAVPRAWARGRRTILSADAVLFLAAAVLYALAVGQVRGFAFTLGISTVLDLIVVFLVTHPLVAVASKSKFLSSPKLSGLGSTQRSAVAQRAARATAGTAAKEV